MLYIFDVLDDSDSVLGDAGLVLLVLDEDVPAHGSQGYCSHSGYLPSCFSNDLVALPSKDHLLGRVQGPDPSEHHNYGYY